MSIITNVRGSELPRIDAITFGSPCQDFSMAGQRKGMQGNKLLIAQAIRLISECKPSFFGKMLKELSPQTLAKTFGQLSAHQHWGL